MVTSVDIMENYGCIKLMSNINILTKLDGKVRYKLIDGQLHTSTTDSDDIEYKGVYDSSYFDFHGSKIDVDDMHLVHLYSVMRMYNIISIRCVAANVTSNPLSFNRTRPAKMYVRLMYNGTETFISCRLSESGEPLFITITDDESSDQYDYGWI